MAKRPAPPVSRGIMAAPGSMFVRPDNGLTARDDMVTVICCHGKEPDRAPPGTGLAVALLCTLAALTGCAGGYGLAVVTGGIEEAGR